MLFGLLNLCFTTAGQVESNDIPMLMVGYGFGASFVGTCHLNPLHFRNTKKAYRPCDHIALFMQLGGGIYTKGADVGADLVGKVGRLVWLGCKVLQ